ncbi:MAG: hypothetical protein HOQ09_08115, partial [Gemmatimonadaceae bacterium]|nr:hypothetical protein [Gemmatimonadaceae bacterium]
RRDQKVAVAVALVERGHILLDLGDRTEDVGALRDDAPASSQVAAALAARCWSARCGEREPR